MSKVTRTERPSPPGCPPGARREPAGVIRADESYSVSEFLRRVGWRRTALRTARRDGLRTILAGGRSYILGEDWMAYLKKLSAAGNDGGRSFGVVETQADSVR